MAKPTEDRSDTGFQQALDPILKAVRPHAHWALRSIFAAVFLYHGITKFTGGVGGFAAGVGIPVWAAYLVALAEVASGLGIVVGGFGPEWLTRLAGIAIVPVMLGAIAMVHWPRWSFVPAEGYPMGGMEFQVTLTALGLYFAAVGNDA